MAGGALPPPPPPLPPPKKKKKKKGRKRGERREGEEREIHVGLTGKTGRGGLTVSRELVGIGGPNCEGAGIQIANFKQSIQYNPYP